MSRLEGKVALVTGASKGIGAGIAAGRAEAGGCLRIVEGDRAPERREAEGRLPHPADALP